MLKYTEVENHGPTQKQVYCHNNINLRQPAIKAQSPNVPIDLSQWLDIKLVGQLSVIKSQLITHLTTKQ